VATKKIIGIKDNTHPALNTVIRSLNDETLLLPDAAEIMLRLAAFLGWDNCDPKGAISIRDLISLSEGGNPFDQE
jgi:hypothetical protein